MKGLKATGVVAGIAGLLGRRRGLESGKVRRGGIERALAVITGTALVMSLMVVVASPALAHHPILDVSAACDAQGNKVVTWTVSNGNWDGKTMTISDVQYTDGTGGWSTIVTGLSLAPDGAATESITYGLSETGSKTLSVTAGWSDGGPQGISASLTIKLKNLECKDGTTSTTKPDHTTTTADATTTTTEMTTTTTEATTTTTEATTTTIVGFAPTTGQRLEIPSITALCVEAVPYLSYDIDFPGATSATITFLNPDGKNLVYEDVPLSGRVLWPGANDDPLDWPGWVLEDGLWVFTDDGFLWARGQVEVLFEVNPSATLTVPYPEASEDCADPENPEDSVLGTVITNTTAGSDEVEAVEVLPFTGSDDVALITLAVSAIALGAILVLSARREEG